MKTDGEPLKTVDPPEISEMRIVCISDTHGLHRKLVLPEADILIHAGDFMVHGRSAEEIDDFNEWLGTLPYRHRIVVAGNHDLLLESNPAEARAHLSNAVYLENAGITLDGVSFWGCPVTPGSASMGFQQCRARRGEVLEPGPSRNRCARHARAAVRNSRQGRHPFLSHGM
jgi:hypothetical protein